MRWVTCLGERRRCRHMPDGQSGPDPVSCFNCASHRGSFSDARKRTSTYSPANTGITGKFRACWPCLSVLNSQDFVCFASGTAKLLTVVLPVHFTDHLTCNNKGVYLIITMTNFASLPAPMKNTVLHPRTSITRSPRISLCNTRARCPGNACPHPEKARSFWRLQIV